LVWRANDAFEKEADTVADLVAQGIKVEPGNLKIRGGANLLILW